MDSISLTIYRYRNALIDIDILNAEKNVFSNLLKTSDLKIEYLENRLTQTEKERDLINDIRAAENDKSKAEIMYLKSRTSFFNSFKSYLLLLLAGFGIGVIAF